MGMDYEQLFVESKWGILKSLAERGRSPLELAQALNTTISNVSQQLRLLEMAGLVEKEKIQNRDKGKPRAIYSISDNHLYLILVSKFNARKQLISLTPHQMILLNIWLQYDKNEHYFLEHFCLHIEEKFPDLKVLAMEKNGNGFKCYLLVAGQEGKERKASFKVTNGPIVKEFDYLLLTEEEFLKKVIGNVSVLYDSQGFILRNKRGGLGDEKRKK